MTPPVGRSRASRSTDCQVTTACDWVFTAVGWRWDRHWRTDAYFRGHPFLTAAAADHLAAEGAALVGIDSLNIHDTSSGERPGHSALLAAGIPICEHLTDLAALPIDRFLFSAAPVKVHGMGTFP